MAQETEKNQFMQNIELFPITWLTKCDNLKRKHFLFLRKHESIHAEGQT